MTIESETLRKRVREAYFSQKQPTVTVLSSLLAVQDVLGYIPEEAIGELAELTHATINDVWGVASFYTNFRFTPPGRHQIEVCWGPSCHLRGAPDILHGLLEALGLPGEGDTQDGRFTLRYNTCLGACAQAPVISVDHRLLGRATAEEAKGQVGRLNGTHP